MQLAGVIDEAERAALHRAGQALEGPRRAGGLARTGVPAALRAALAEPPAPSDFLDPATGEPDPARCEAARQTLAGLQGQVAALPDGPEKQQLGQQVAAYGEAIGKPSALGAAIQRIHGQLQATSPDFGRLGQDLAALGANPLLQQSVYDQVDRRFGAALAGDPALVGQLRQAGLDFSQLSRGTLMGLLRATGDATFLQALLESPEVSPEQLGEDLLALFPPGPARERFLASASPEALAGLPSATLAQLGDDEKLATAYDRARRREAGA
jgi:hypothetical protein